MKIWRFTTKGQRVWKVEKSSWINYWERQIYQFSHCFVVCLHKISINRLASDSYSQFEYAFALFLTGCGLYDVCELVQLLFGGNWVNATSKCMYMYFGFCGKHMKTNRIRGSKHVYASGWMKTSIFRLYAYIWWASIAYPWTKRSSLALLHKPYTFIETLLVLTMFGLHVGNHFRKFLGRAGFFVQLSES